MAETNGEGAQDTSAEVVRARDRLRVRVSELEALTDAPAVADEMDRLLGLILDAQVEAVVAPGQSIAQLARSIHALALEKEWWDDRQRPMSLREQATDIAARLALVHAEVSEALEEVRMGRFGSRRVDGKPEGLPAELADIVIRVFDLAEGLRIDIETAIIDKHEYNKSRPVRHGGKLV